VKEAKVDNKLNNMKIVSRCYCIAYCAVVCFLVSCSNNMQEKNTNSSGNINLYVEESFRPLFETSIYTFEGQKPLAKIDAHYTNETSVFDAFYNGKTSTICVTRDFTQEEKKFLRSKQNVEVRSNKIAIDALALIVNPNNTDTLMTVERLNNILKGTDSLWQHSNKKINVVFDQANSANFHYLQQIASITALPQNVYALNSNQEVINHVKENPSALGIIGVNWISDEDSPTTFEFRKGIKVISVAKNENEEFVKPYQAYIYEGYYNNKSYPLVREVWMINKAGKTTLNSGFVNFMLGEKGQLIISRSSLVAANMPTRIVNFK